MDIAHIERYKEIAKQSRIKCLQLVYSAQTSHIGSLMSCADIFAVLFERLDLKKDKFILSAGWKACMLYYHLWRKGRITEDELNSYCMPGSKWIGLIEPIHKDIPFGAGSMGMGLPAAVGYALSKKLKGEEGRVYVLMSDGEMQCGTTWESALIATHHNLDNLIVIVDYNKFQAMGKTNEILNIEPLQNKWDSFGWHNISLMEKGGHNYEVILEGLKAIEDKNKFLDKKPGVIIAHTIKGKGVLFMENNNLYHYKQLSSDEYERAISELNKV